jgi:hypothetical protein
MQRSPTECVKRPSHELGCCASPKIFEAKLLNKTSIWKKDYFKTSAESKHIQLMNMFTKED